MEYSDLVGVPFKYGGRDSAGMDCWGVVVAVYRALGIGVEDVGEYDAVLATDANPVFERVRTQAWHPAREPYEPYDVLLYAGGCCGTAATHCAVYIGRGRMLHALQGRGVVISRVRSFPKRLLGAWRHEALVCHA